jgi:hypothetical protein
LPLVSLLADLCIIDEIFPAKPVRLILTLCPPGEEEVFLTLCPPALSFLPLSLWCGGQAGKRGQQVNTDIK